MTAQANSSANGSAAAAAAAAATGSASLKLLAANGSGSSNGASSSVDKAKGRAVEEEEDGTAFAPMFEGSNIDKREFVRLAMQSLKEMGYDSSVKALEEESGLTLEHASIVAFRTAVLSGDWRNAERLLLEGLTSGAARVAARQGGSHARIASGAAGSVSAPNLDVALRSPQTQGLDSIKFLLHQQRYLELLEAQQTKKALSVLRDRLAPLNHGSEKLHQLSSLVMCSTPEELRARAQWDGTGAASRRKLLQDIENAVSPAIMIPSRRLPQLLDQAQTLQKQRDPFFNLPTDAPLTLYVDHRSDKSVFPTHTSAILRGHGKAQVWDLAWSNNGKLLATAGGKARPTGDSDCYVIVWKAKSMLAAGENLEDEWVTHTRLGPMRESISNVAWSPDDTMLLVTHHAEVTLFWLAEGRKKRFDNAHEYAVGTVAWLPGGRSFVTGAMDHKIIVRSIDGNILNTINTAPFRILALDVSPNGRHLVAVGSRPLANNLAAAAEGSSRRHVAPPSAATQTSYAAYASSSSPLAASHPSGVAADDESGSTSALVNRTLVDLGGGSRTLGEEKHQILFYDLERRESAGSVYMWDEMMSVCISADSRYALINARPNESQLWDINSQTLVGRYSGHKAQDLVIKSCFGGVEKSFVISGSEDGNVYVYHRGTGKLLERLPGHTDTVNSVAWHPTNHSMFASCSDDATVRIWTPKDAARFRALNSAASAAAPLEPAPAGRAMIGARLVQPQRFGTGEGAAHDVGPSPFPWASSPGAADLELPPPSAEDMMAE